MSYDSECDTRRHIQLVQKWMFRVIHNLIDRARDHDASKLGPPEKEWFDAATEKLRGLTYGSDEYKASLKALGPALKHHYEHNDHHPEHHAKFVCIICFKEFTKEPEGRCDACGNGTFSNESIHGMDLLQITEMLCDWKAATMRHWDGDIIKSVEINAKRFGIDPQLKRILLNTINRLGMAK